VNRARPLLLLIPLLALAAPAMADTPSAFTSDVGQSRKALAQAQSQADAARRRGEALEGQAAQASAAADATARQAAALAARIQQAQAEIVADETAIRIIASQQAELKDSLAAHEWPLLRLTAALQRLSRRPLALALLHPGSVEDAVHLRAVLESTMPEVRRRTADLRGQLLRARGLQQQAAGAAQALREEQRRLTTRQTALAQLEARQRLAAQSYGGSADRETESANALAEQARDLGDLVGTLEQAATLRDRLALLPGPILRPPRPGQSEVVTAPEPAPQGGAPQGYVLPVLGRLVSGFGEVASGDGASGAPSRGITIAAQPGAQVVAPAAGRVAFAGAYRGFGDIIILDHAGEWVSVVTGLGNLDARVGDELVGGAPLGVVGPGKGELSLELRHDGAPVNPLSLMHLP